MHCKRIGRLDNGLWDLRTTTFGKTAGEKMRLEGLLCVSDL